MDRPAVKLGPIIVLEGLPGSGKTTLLRRLKRLQAVKVVPQIIYSGRRSTQPRSLYYIANDVRKATRARNFSERGYTVVVDRGFLSTLAYTAASDSVHHRRSLTRLERIVSRLVGDRVLSPPTLWIYIRVSPATSIERKGRNRRSYYVWEDFDFLQAMDTFSRAWLKNSGGRVTYIDGDQTPSEVYAAVRAVIKRVNPK